MIHVEARTSDDAETFSFDVERWGLRIVARPKPRPQAWVVEWMGDGCVVEAAFDDRLVAEGFYDRFRAAATSGYDVFVEVMGVLGDDERTITAVLRNDPSVEDLDALPSVAFRTAT